MIFIFKRINHISLDKILVMERRKFLQNTCPTVTFAFFGLSFIQACSKSDDEGSSYSSNSNISGSTGQSSQGTSTQTNDGINQSGSTVTLDLSNSTFSNLTNPGDFINLLSINIIILNNVIIKSIKLFRGFV